MEEDMLCGLPSVRQTVDQHRVLSAGRHPHQSASSGSRTQSRICRLRHGVQGHLQASSGNDDRGVGGRSGRAVLVMTDLAVDAAGVCWYALRFWIELGFRALKSLGWQWNKTRRTDPQRVSRHWLVLSVATLLTMAYGSRVEDAADLGREPGNLRAPPKCLSPTHRSAHSSPGRSVSVLRLGTAWLRRLLNRGRVWKRVWLLPEEWPKPPPGMKIIQHTPP